MMTFIMKIRRFSIVKTLKGQLAEKITFVNNGTVRTKVNNITTKKNCLQFDVVHLNIYWKYSFDSKFFPNI